MERGEILARRIDMYKSIYSPEFTSSDSQLQRAYLFAQRAHEGQYRQSGEPYFTHPLAVVKIIQSWGIEDLVTIQSGFLHDVVEDCDGITQDMISAEFGSEVSYIVDGVSQLRNAAGLGDDRETKRKILKTQYLDPRVALVKIADRLHNLQTLDAMPAYKQKAKAIETLETYTHLAESLGMWVVKTQLEDLAYPFIAPEEYKKVRSLIDSDPRLTDEYLYRYVSTLENIFSYYGIDAVIEIKLGGYFQLCKKREAEAFRGKSGLDTFSEINDLVSIRVQVSNISDCYKALGLVHEKYGSQIDFSRFDEFIADPRGNGYRALQTTLQTSNGALEIAIMTKEMEQFNNWGIVSLIKRGERNLENYTRKSVFVNNGNGERLMFVPKDATGIDVAYLISKDYGARAIGVIINEKQFPLSVNIPNASAIQLVLGEPRRAPDPGVKDYALPSTRKKIDDQLISQSRDDAVKDGVNKMVGLLSSRGLMDLEDLPGDSVEKLLYSFDCLSVNQLYFQLGISELICQRLEKWFDDEGVTKEKLGLYSIYVKGADVPGVLGDLTSWIRNYGGNIRGIAHKRDKTGEYSLRIVVEKLTVEGIDVIPQLLENDPRFSTYSFI